MGPFSTTGAVELNAPSATRWLAAAENHAAASRRLANEQDPASARAFISAAIEEHEARSAILPPRSGRAAAAVPMVREEGGRSEG